MSASIIARSCSTISRIFPGDRCLAGDRTSQVEGASSGREVVFTRVENEANWSVPHLNPGVLSLADGKGSSDGEEESSAGVRRLRGWAASGRAW